MNEETPPNQRSLLITGILVVLSLGLCLAWFWQMIFVIPEYERMFADFRVRVPAFTEATISLTRVFVKFWFVLLIFTLFIAYPVIGYVSFYLRHRSNQRALMWLWFVWIIGSPLAVQIITFFAVWKITWVVDGLMH